MNSKDFAIGILSTTAAILLVGVLIIHSRPAPAFASGMSVTGGEYTMTVGNYTQNDEEVVFVVDSRGKPKLVVYRFNTGTHQIEVADAISLDQMRDASSPAGQSKNAKSATRS